MSSDIVAFAVPYKTIVKDMLEDDRFLASFEGNILVNKFDFVALAELLKQTIIKWIDDTLVRPLEDVITKTSSVGQAEELYRGVTDSHEFDMEVYEKVITHPSFLRYKDAIENSIRSSFDIWDIEITGRTIYVSYVNDFRIKYFDKCVKNIDIKDYVRVKDA